MGVGAGRGEGDVEVGEFGLDELVVGERGGELGAGVGVREYEGKGCLHEAAGQFQLGNWFWGRRGGLATYPIGPALSTRRSMSRPSIRTLTPRLTVPRTFSCGTKTLSKMSSPVLEPRMPNLSSLRAQKKPEAAEGTMKAVMPLEPWSGSVLA